MSNIKMEEQNDILTLKDIFVPQANKRLYAKQELFVLIMNRDFLNRMATQLNLTYLENNTSTYNVCFVNSNEVRPAFRTVFTKTDIVYYVSGVLEKDCFDIDADQIPFPNDVTTFWRIAKALANK